MKKCAFVLSVSIATALTLGARPAAAQLGGLTGALNTAAKAKKIADLKVTDAEERQIGQAVSDKMVETFGVYQDANVTKYVTLVGAVLALQSPRPGLDWQFVVLDTEGVNAFAAPGGFIHITKGLLGLMKDEAELAGVLAHEIIHVTEKHTVNAIQKGDTIKVASDEVGSAGMAQSLVAKMVEKAYSDILNNKFSRNDEGEADEKGITLANKVGYAPCRPELGADEAVRSQQGLEGTERALCFAPAAEGSHRQDRHTDQRQKARRDGDRSAALREEHYL